MGWELPAIIVVALLLVFGLVWIFAGRWVSASKKGSVSTDDVGELSAGIKLEDKAEEVRRAQPKTARALREWLRGDKL